jgi:hypothetical protein
MGGAKKGLPPVIAKLFGEDAELLIAIPEHKVLLGDTGRESQSDVFAIIKANNRTIAVTVEGKVNESFRPTIMTGIWAHLPENKRGLPFYAAPCAAISTTRQFALLTLPSHRLGGPRS